jgi:hypothetical protein
MNVIRACLYPIAPPLGLLLCSVVACGRTDERANDTSRPPDTSASASGHDTAAVSSSSPAESTMRRALDVIREYYAAIDARDYARAYAAWAPDGPPGHPSLEEFRRGFAETASVSLALGDPGRLEGAAGSRYLEVPVTVTSTQRDGRTARFTGSYTLRQSVVPGASDAARRWHLYAAQLVRSEAPTDTSAGASPRPEI